MRTQGVPVFVALALVALGACSYVGGRTEPFRQPAREEPAGLSRGRNLYMRDCAWCHGSEAEGTTRGPDLIGGTNGEAFTHFMLTTGRMPINEPTDPVTRRDRVYTEGEIEDIVAFVTSLDGEGPPIPEVDADTGDLSLGLRLYQENCAACHSTTGIGGALTTGRAGAIEGEVAKRSGIIAPAIDEASPTEIAEAMAVGPGTMPVFSGETFEDDEVDAIVRYVVYLQDPQDRGGADLGGIGTVTEGAVALVVGLGALLLLIRWTGTTRREE
jgi:ubiquinol-cytochrome c reductase cytochrome c subunit